MLKILLLTPLVLFLSLVFLYFLFPKWVKSRLGKTGYKSIFSVKPLSQEYFEAIKNGDALLVKGTKSQVRYAVERLILILVVLGALYKASISCLFHESFSLSLFFSNGTGSEPAYIFMLTLIMILTTKKIIIGKKTGWNSSVSTKRLEDTIITKFDNASFRRELGFLCCCFMLILYTLSTSINWSLFNSHSFSESNKIAYQQCITNMQTQEDK